MTNVNASTSHAVSDTAHGSCPAADTVSRFLAGLLSPWEREAYSRHIDHCPGCETVLLNVVADTGNRPAASSGELRFISSQAAFQPGDVLGERYQIMSLLGVGGMGEVYDVQDLSLNERVALKTVRGTIADSPTAVARIKSEVLMTRRVTHPNVCRVYDFGVHALAEPGAAPIPFLTMEILRGPTLAQCIRKRGPLSSDAAVATARQAAAGLAAAHAAGVIHKDFKSDNIILVDPDGTSPRAVVTDFGLATATRAALEPVGSTTGFSGTPGYVAPERLSGAEATFASDVFAFGVVVQDMLTGVLPPPGSEASRRLTTPRTTSTLRRLTFIAEACCASAPDKRPTMEIVRRRLDRLARDPVRGPARIAGAVVLSLVSATVVLALRAPPAPAPGTEPKRTLLEARAPRSTVTLLPPPAPTLPPPTLGVQVADPWRPKRHLKAPVTIAAPMVADTEPSVTARPSAAEEPPPVPSPTDEPIRVLRDSPIGGPAGSLQAGTPSIADDAPINPFTARR